MTDKPIPMHKGDIAPGPGCFVPLVLNEVGDPMCGAAGMPWESIVKDYRVWTNTEPTLRVIDAALREAAKDRPLQVGDKVMVGGVEGVLRAQSLMDDTLPYLVHWPDELESWLPAAAVRRADQ